jgi:AraC family transcriptional regulator
MHHFALASLKCAAALKNTLIATSASGYWTSCLLDHVEGDNSADVHETHETSDLTVVVATRGEHEVAVFENGRWHQAIYQAGAAGLTPGGETTRLRWRNRKLGFPFRTAHLYIPETMIMEAAELYRRPGEHLSAGVMSTLVVNDQVAASVVKSLLKASDSGAPDIYAETAIRWLSVHLIARFSNGVFNADGDRRTEFLSDLRLARAVEFMTANLSRQISVDDIAREAGVSPFHFTRLFREKIGMAPHRYLTCRRMEKAQRLLTTTDLPVSLVGVECGYSRGSSFTAAFTQHFGTPPARFPGIIRSRP